MVSDHHFADDFEVYHTYCWAWKVLNAAAIHSSQSQHFPYRSRQEKCLTPGSWCLMGFGRIRLSRKYPFCHPNVQQSDSKRAWLGSSRNWETQRPSVAIQKLRCRNQLCSFVPIIVIVFKDATTRTLILEGPLRLLQAQLEERCEGAPERNKLCVLFSGASLVSGCTVGGIYLGTSCLPSWWVVSGAHLRFFGGFLAFDSILCSV